MAVLQLAVSGVMYTDQRDWYPDPDFVARLFPSETPFVSDLFQMTPENAPDVDYKMFQKTPRWRDMYFDANGAAAWDAAVAAGTPTDTITLTVDGATGITVDDSIVANLIEVWSSDLVTYRGLLRVQSVTNATTVIGESVGNPSSTTEAVAAIVDNDRFFIVGSAHGEVSEAPDADSQNPEVVWNTMFHHRTALELSYDVANAAMRGLENAQSKLSESQTDTAQEHKIKLERSLWTSYRVDGIGLTAFGADSTGATSDSTFAATHIPNTTVGRVRTTMGYIPAVLRYGKRTDSEDEQSYFARTKATYSYSNFVDDMLKIGQWEDDPSMPGVRDAYCGPAAYSYWTKFAIENMGAGIQIEHSAVDAAAGYRYTMFHSPDIDLRLIKCPDWRGRYKNHCAIPNKRFLRLRKLANSGEGTEDPGLLGYYPDIKKDNRPLKRKDEYHSHFGLDIRHLPSQCLIVFS